MVNSPFADYAEPLCAVQGLMAVISAACPDRDWKTALRHISEAQRQLQILRQTCEHYERKGKTC